MLDALGFDEFNHVSHVFCTSIGVQFLDLMSTLTFRPGLILFEGVEDGRRTLVLENIDHSVIRMAIREGEDMFPPANRFDIRFA